MVKIEKKTKGKVEKTEDQQGSEVPVEGEDFVAMYERYEAAAKARAKSGDGVGTAVFKDVIEKLFALGKSEISLAACAAAIKEQSGGKKVYNQLRSFINGKTSVYALATDAEGHVVIVRKNE